MTLHKIAEAWVAMPTEDDIRRMMPPDNPYDFGFIPAMTRLIMSHPRIGMAFGALFSQIMFEPGRLSRNEREMIAAVAASAQNCFY